MTGRMLNSKDSLMAGTMPRGFVYALRCLCLAASLALGLASQPSPSAAEEAWPAPSDGILTNDPSVVWGRLPNGLRYAIMPNQTPPGRVSLRLVIAAGSLMENEQQLGLAHFSSTWRSRARPCRSRRADALPAARGLAFGADTNASTGFDATSTSSTCRATSTTSWTRGSASMQPDPMAGCCSPATRSSPSAG